MVQVSTYSPDPVGPKPLARHALFQSTDLDETREKVAQVFCPHRLDVIGFGQTKASHNHIKGEHLSLNYIEYGAKTVISPGELGSFHLLQIPLRGGASICNGSDNYYSGPSAAAVLNPHRETTMIWEEGTQQLLVQIDRMAMQTHLASLIGGYEERPLSFSGPLDLTRGIGLSLRNLIFHMVAEIDGKRSPFGGNGLMSRQLENTIMTGLIEGLPHNYSHLLGRRTGSATPRHLRLAEVYIEEHIDLPLTLEDIASAACTTPRTLQNAFRQFRSTTPLRYLRDARLTRANQDLLKGSPYISVTDVATQWGFTHLGRFSQVYKVRFGETPQATLLGARSPNWSD